ncbi:cilia- and flagella-associated protein 54 isoform X2 [Hydra vulgaris]|uniref:cilia- and flagella-associated protein 54 isoform X2 n=1 Tax=Hydra vulgaris TaxID=6087 RepID=UPI001F5E7208|nr:cilia- and flagella-associated protein 54-like isoform X2 [Hydra vulgaris]
MNTGISFEQDVAALIEEIKSTKKPKISIKKRVPALIKLWHKYETYIKKNQLSLKLIKIGEILLDEQDYGMAAKCFGLYLQETHLFRQEKIFEEDYVKTFFNNKIFDESLIKAFLCFGSCMASYYLDEDPNFQVSTSKMKIEQMLNILQLTSEKAITKSSYSWLVYNCTIHIYNICLKLLMQKLSTIAIDYLIWCCVCMESSIPLMTVKYLTWRTQLYIATSECYYILNSGVCGEEFAIRGLQKVIELKEIEKMSSSTPCPLRLQMFKESFLKLKITIFKRDVFESRKHAKSLKPKFKLVLNEILHNKWPRTACEQLLIESFNGRSAQFFAVIETLASKEHETIKRQNIQHEDENEQELISELFFAGVELATLNGHDEDQRVNRISVSESIITLAVAESDLITLSSLTKFLILAFMHEKWEIFENLIYEVLHELEKHNNKSDYILERQILQILSAFSIMVPSYQVRTGLKIKKEKSMHEAKKVSVKDLLNVSKLLSDFVTNESSNMFISKYHSMLVDIVLFIWSAFKPHFTYEISQGHIHTLLKETSFCMIFEILIKIHHVMVAVGIQNVNLTFFIEATLTVSIFIEQFVEKSQFGEIIPFSISPEIMKQAASILNVKMDTLCFLHFINNLLLSALKFIQTAKNLMKLFVEIKDVKFDEDKKSNARNVAALHLELMFKQQCIATLIDYYTPKEEIKSASSIKTLTKNQAKLKTKCFIANNGCENDLSKALFIISKASVKNSQASKMLKEASQLLQKELHIIKKSNLNTDGSLIPPAPILVCQGLNCVVLKPAPFPTAGNVAYYSIYLRLATSKGVTLNDVSFEGTGDLVQSSSDCLFVVKGLAPNTAYIAAVAAFNEKLILVGGSIGNACSPFYTIDSFPAVQAFAYLTQVAYKCQVYEIAKYASELIWNFFVSQDDNMTNLSSKNDTFKRLNFSTFNNSSTVLQRLFVQTIFISADVIIKEEQLYWYNVAMKSQLANNQLERINLCRKIILGVQVSALLNDESLCMQGCVLIYELLFPIVYWKLLICPALQIIEFLFAILQELKNVLKYMSFNSDTLRMMIICLTNYTAKILVSLKSESAAISVLQLGKNICSNILSNGHALDSVVSVNKVNLHQKVRKRLSVSCELKEFYTREIKLHTIELLALKLSNQEKDLLFNGGEDSIIFKIDLDNMTSLEAYNEVFKFKKRADFLENFVGVISKALNERSFNNVIKWTEETLSLLKINLKFLIANENESCVEMKDDLQVTDNNGDAKKDEKKIQKNENKHIKKPHQTNKLRNVIKRSDLCKKNKLTNQTKEQESTVKLNFKAAFKDVLPKFLHFLKLKQQRMKLRVLSHIELPWRCQMYLINGECHFQIALEKFTDMVSQGSTKNVISHPTNQLEIECNSERIIDSNMFSLGSLGVLLVNWLGSMKGPLIQTDNIKVCAFEDQSVENDASLPPIAIKKPKYFDKKFLEHFKEACLFLKRAMILAHRGKHWMLLQQACNNLLVYTQVFVFKVVVNTSLDSENQFYIHHLRSIIFMNFYYAADLILDMISVNLKNKVQHKCFSDCLIENYDISYADMMRVMFFAIEVLFYEKKFDKVCILIIRLNELTQEFYCEELFPLLSYSKQHLKDTRDGVLKTQDTRDSILKTHLLTSKLKIKSSLCNSEETKKSALLDEFSHKHQINVVFHAEEVLKKFYSCLETKSKNTQLLKHSRKLLFRYLAGKIGVVKNLLINAKTFSNEPINLWKNSFSSIEDVEVQPLVLDSDLAIVIASYENTINYLLQQQSEYAASAMNELGNIFFHLKDKRSANMWWSKAIDSVVKRSEGLKSWRELILADEKSILACKKLLEKFDIWGCLLVSVLAAKIARYIYDGNVSSCIDACQMSAAFVKAIFCCSINHPLSCADYATYKIGQAYPTKHVLPGINLFSDDHNVNSASLLVNMIWTCKQLLVAGYCIEIQPLLTFSQYLSDQIGHLSSAVEVKIARVSSLIQLNLLNPAIDNFIDIISGFNLPAPADVISRNIFYKWPLIEDDILTSHEFLNSLCQFNVTPHHLVAYGSSLCYQVRIQQAVLLSAIASLSFEYPKFEKNDMNCNKSFLESKMREFMKITEKDDSLPSIISSFDCLLRNSAQLRGKLLGRSKQILNGILTTSSEDCMLTLSQQFEFFINCHLELAHINEQQLMFTRSIDHIYLCLQAFNTFDVNRLKENALGYCKSSSSVCKVPDFSVNMWMVCKIKLCSLLTQRIIFQPNHGSVKEANEILFQAIVECKTFNDVFSLFAFEFLKLKSDIHNGMSVSDAVSKLEEIQNFIVKLHEIPLPIKYLLFEVQTMKAEFYASICLDTSMKFYLVLENSILNEMLFHGLTLDSNFKYPLLNQKCSNSKLFFIFLAVKFRSLSLQAKSVNSNNQVHKIEILSNLLNEISVCLSTFCLFMINEVTMATEMKFLKGQIERLLYEFGCLDIMSCIATFLDIITTTCTLTGDLNMSQQCCCEIALALLYKIKTNKSTNPPGHICYYFSWLCIHTASAISEFEQNTELYRNIDSVITNHDEFPEFLKEDLGEKMIYIKDVLHYIAQLNNPNTLYSSLGPVYERKRSFAYSTGYFNPVYKLRAMHAYFFASPHYNVSIFSALKYISNFEHLINHRSVGSSVILDDLDARFNDTIFSSTNEVAICWYTSDLFSANGFVYFLMALSKKRIDGLEFKKMLQVEISNSVEVFSENVAIKSIVALHQQLVKSMVPMGILYDDSASTTGLQHSNTAGLHFNRNSNLLQHQKKNDESNKELEKLRKEFVQILSKFRSELGKNDDVPLLLNQKNVCDLEKILNVNRNRIIMASDSLTDWL